MSAQLPDLQTIANLLRGKVEGDHVRFPGPGHSAKDDSAILWLDRTDPDGFRVNSHAGDPWPLVKGDVRAQFVSAGWLEPWKPNGPAGAPKAKNRAEPVKRAPETPVKPPTFVEAYHYKQVNGDLYLRVQRYADPKTFKQKHWTGSGWVWGKPVGQKIPYRLPELVASACTDNPPPVVVCEGEKDADNVAKLGLVATTNSGGALSWTADLNQHFEARTVYILPHNDADGKGRKHALDVAENLHPVADSVRIVVLPGLPPKGGDVSDWLEAGGTAEALLALCEAAPIYEPGAVELETERPEQDAQDEAAENEDEAEALPFIDVGAWEGAPIPEREWAVLDVIPAKNVTLLTGQGGGGKTTLAMQLCAASVLGRDWLTHMPEPGKAMIVCCEDDGEEMHRRLDRIAAYYGASFADLARGGLHLLSFAGRDAVLAAPDRAGVIKPTALFDRIRKAAIEIRPRILVLDNAADVYAGNENERGMVRQFITLLRGLAMDCGAAVVLTLHPSLTGINTGTGMSGNTAWFNSARGQLYLKTAATEDGETPDPDLRELEARKNNYGPLASKTMLRWRDGVFVVERTTAGHLDKMATAQKAEELFLTLLDRFNRQGRNVSHKKGPTYGPALFAKEAPAKEAGVKGDAFEKAMSRLFASDAIHLEPYGPPCRGTSRLVSGSPK
jgi:RecA-family ATPase